MDKLSANALATATSIRIRRDARFTDRDASQLLNPETYIHSATSLNGRAQPELPILAAGRPGTTRTQEGLDVFAEIIGGSAGNSTPISKGCNAASARLGGSLRARR